MYFRNLVSNQLKSQPAYMNEDLFLIRWLRAKNLDARQAERMLNEHFKWRKENKIDQINDEDWTEFERETPWYLDGVNKAGFPVAELPFGDWNVRRVALSGKLPKLLRYCFKLFENVEERIRNLRAQGKNVTQWGFIGDIDGFTIQTQACPICTPFYAGYISTLETNYPGAMDKVFAVNTPSSFETVIRLMTPLMRADTRTAMEVFGVNKQQWIKRLDSYIDRDQRSERFGGTKVRDSI
ncbi:SEC14-like protein 2 [Orchesella cincta]|uniref:SEC14-like protein 2 n=1 Tax=Orchesella cincta TaxID=48709 RepID=A0A1D2N2I1_ORCCI|nr:SEC14-like protein 2 [Orchesella cincta]